jgi:uncharacterized protein (DUF779 family)
MSRRVQDLRDGADLRDVMAHDDEFLDKAWHQEQFLLDVAPGEPEDFSLPAGDNLHFVTRSPICVSPSAPDENVRSSTPREHTMRAG